MNQNPTPVASASEHDTELDFTHIIGILLDAKWLLAGFSAAGLVLGLAYALLSTPIYRVDALVQVESGKQAGMSGLNDLTGMFETKSSIPAEIELIRSRMVLGQTAQELGLDVSVTPVYLPVIGQWLNDPASLNLGRVQWAEGSGSALTLTVLDAQRYQVHSGKVNLGEGQLNAEFTSSEVSLFVRGWQAKAGQEFVIAKRNLLSVTNGLASSLGLAEKSRGSDMIQISYESPDPVFAAKLVNQVANNYLRQNVERKSAEAEQTLKFLDTQLPQIKQQLEAAEVRFNDYRARNRILDISADGQRLLQQSVGVESGLFELQQKRKELLTRLTAAHPSVEALDRQIAGLQAQQNKFNAEVGSLPKEQQELLRLTRDLQVNQELYTQLLNSSQQIKVAKAGTVGNVRIIDAAEVPPHPIKPKKQLIVLGALLAGLLLGAAVEVLRMLLQRGIKEASVVEKHLGLSVLAMVPTSSEQEKLIAQKRKKGGAVSVLAINKPDDLAIEALRSLRTSLHFTLLDAPNNRLMITGPSPMLGKSFVSINLAAIMASAGQRVVVVDADMRRGYLNEYFGVSRNQGLSELIAGDVALSEAIKNTGIEGFDYITSGVLPPNPAELLMHPRFEELLQQLSRQYDQVIIDSPPVLAVTDAAIIGRYSGAALLLARFAATPLRELEVAQKRLQLAGVHVNGVVLNGVDVSKGYGYGYGYGNKYAYAYDYQKRKD